MSMKTRNIIPSLLFLATVFSLASAMAEDRPNIVLFLADDMGYGELGCYAILMQSHQILTVLQVRVFD